MGQEEGGTWGNFYPFLTAQLYPRLALILGAAGPVRLVASIPMSGCKEAEAEAEAASHRGTLTSLLPTGLGSLVVRTCERGTNGGDPVGEVEGGTLVLQQPS